jgi:hypothetical protein
MFLVKGMNQQFGTANMMDGKIIAVLTSKMLE